jgi:hypothetical protein
MVGGPCNDDSVGNRVFLTLAATAAPQRFCAAWSMQEV